MHPEVGEITRTLSDLTAGHKDAADRLLELVYDELRDLAAACLAREPAGHTLQPTALVHEAYLRLVDQSRVTWQSRAHFFAVASTAIRRVLVDHARRRQADKRGGMRQRIPLEQAEEQELDTPTDVAELDEALTRLAAFDTRKSRVVELRFFGGLSIEETAEVLAVSHATVERDWTMARAWLFQELHGEAPNGP